MNKVLKTAIVAIGIAVAILGSQGCSDASAAGASTGTAQSSTPGSSAVSEAMVREKMNSWTVGLAGGQLEGAPIRLASEIARVVDDGDNLHVLPIVTRGPAENVEALLYLRGVDVAIIKARTRRTVQTVCPEYPAADQLYSEPLPVRIAHIRAA